jgi:PST family polysaccharide transporter
MPESLRQSVRRNSRSVAATQGVSQIISIVVLAVLWRQLGPDPYGLFNMVWPLLVLARIVITSGLDMVTVQQHAMDDLQISALFWVNQALGLAAALITAACAPLLAWFYGVAELGWLTVGVAGTSMAFVLGMQHQAILQRKMRLGALWGARVAALGLAGATAVTLAMLGAGAWALVIQQYVELLFLAGFVWYLEPWRPRLAVRGAGGRRLVRLGGHFTVSHLALYLMMYVDKVLVGRLTGTTASTKYPGASYDSDAMGQNVHSLGIYSQAYSLAMKPVNVLVTPLTGILLPTLAKSRNVPAQFEAFLLGFFRFLLLVTLPIGAGLAITAPEIIEILGGPQWREAGPLLAVFGWAIPAQACYQTLAYVFASVGEGRRLSIASGVSAGAVVAVCAVGFFVGRAYGDPLLGTALGYTLGLGLAVLPCYLVLTLRTVGVSLRRFAADVAPLFGAAIVMTAAVVAAKRLLTFASPMPAVGLLAIEVATGAAVYVLLTHRAILGFLRAGLRPPETRDVS